MKKKSFPLSLLLWLVFSLVLPARPAAAEAPPGFRLIDGRPGVALYRKDYGNGQPDFVQVVDLAAGATVDLLYGKPQDNDGKRSRGLFDGPNPAFGYRSITGYWENYAQAKPEAFCVSNGQFFFMPENPSPLALPLKVDGAVLAEGFGYPQYPEKQLMLALWPDRADILPLTYENLYGTTAPDVIGGLTEEANKKPKNAVGRTFVGLLDPNGDGVFEALAILNTGTATQKEAAKSLYSFGAVKVMMLDGGGSTQLVCGGQAYIYTERALPQAIGVSAASAETAAIAQAATLARAAASAQAAALSPAVQPAPGVTGAAPTAVAASVPGSASAAAATIASGETAASSDSASIAGAVVQPPPFSEAAPPADPDGSAPAVAAGSSAQPQALPPEQSLSPTPLPGSQPVVPAPELPASTGAVSSQALPVAAAPMEPEGSGITGDQPGAPAGIHASTMGAVSLPNAGPSDRINMGDVLWLPAVMSPLSFFLLLFARKRRGIRSEMAE